MGVGDDGRHDHVRGVGRDLNEELELVQLELGALLGVEVAKHCHRGETKGQMEMVAMGCGRDRLWAEIERGSSKHVSLEITAHGIAM